MIERTVSLHDVGRLLLRQKKLILLIAFLCAILGFFYALSKPVEYVIEATFKEQGEIKAEGHLQSLREALGGFVDSSQTPSLMKSQQVLKPLISQLGLQIFPNEQTSLTTHLVQAFRAELKKSLPQKDSFLFRNVVYEEEKPLLIVVRCLDAETVEVSSKRRKVEEKIGKTLQIGRLSFQIERLPKKWKPGKSYEFIVIPWFDAVQNLRARLFIDAHKRNRTLYNLSLLYPDRIVGTEILNALSAHYLRFLKKEYDHRIEEELVFLHRRQDELTRAFENALLEQKNYLQNNIKNLGVMDLKQELDEVGAPYRDLFLRSCALEMEEKKLFAWSDAESPLLLESTSIGAHLNRIHTACEDLRRERDLIEGALYAQAIPLRREEALRQVRSDLQLLREKNLQACSLFCDPDRIIVAWAYEVEQGDKESKDFQLYLQNLSHQLAVREKFLLESDRERFDSLDLETARRLLAENSRALEEIKGEKERLLHLCGEIDKEEFELSSLSPFLHDEASQRLLASTVQLQFQLQDQDHYSEKEQERAKRVLQLQRKVLKSHLKRLLETEELRHTLCQEKIASLQRTNLECIHRQTSIHREQILDLIRQRKESIKQEQSLLEQKMEELRLKMRTFPQKWYSERLMKLRAEINGKLMQTVNQLTETKTIGRNLYHIASRTLDEAIPPLHAKKPRLMFFACVGAVGGVIPAVFILFALGVLRGLPLGEDTLRALNIPFAGRIGRSPREDLETVKKALLAMNGKKQIALIMGRGPDYYPLFKDLLHDHSFLLSRTPLDCAETLALINEEQGMIVTICDEPLQDVVPYLNHPCAIFLCASPLH